MDDWRADTNDWHEDDGYGVVVVGFGEPDEEAEDLEDVEGGESFEDQEVEDRADRYVHFVLPVGGSPKTKSVLSSMVQEEITHRKACWATERPW